MRLLATLTVAAVAFLPAMPAVAQPQAAPRFPEQAAYCRPALAAMDRYYDGEAPLEAAVREATAAAEQCLATNPLGAQLSYSQIHLATGKRTEALRAARAAAAIDPNNSEAQRRLCNLVADPAARLAACQRATTLAPTSVLALREMGDLYTGLGRHTEAAVAYTKALEIKPDYAVGWVQRGLLMLAVRQYASALADYERADALLADSSPDSTPAALGKARALTGLGRGAEAIAVLDKRLQIVPDDPALRYQRGITHVAMGRGWEGLRDCGAFLQRYPTHQEARACVNQAKAKIPNLIVEREKRCEPRLPDNGGLVREFRVLSARNGGFSAQAPRLSYGLASGATSVTLTFTDGTDKTPAIYAQAMVTIESNPFHGMSEARRREIYAAIPKEYKMTGNQEESLGTLLQQQSYIERTYGYPIRLELRSGDASITRTHDKNNLVVDLFVRTGNQPEARLAANLLRTGSLGLTLWNSRTGAKLLEREFTASGYLADRATVTSMMDTLRAQHIPFFC